MASFDTFVMCDWSAANEPKRGVDSVWIGHGRGGAAVALENPATRLEAYRRVREILRDAVARGRRVLLGFDFPYGYPAGLAPALGVEGWGGVWDTLAGLVQDDEQNRNNRFEVARMINERLGAGPGPFWGCPRQKADSVLRATKPPFPCKGLDELRAVELTLATRRPKSGWQLLGAGSVGSQSLVGIPIVRALRDDSELAAVSCVWPFEGFGAQIVHAEIWPRVVAVEPEPGEIPDRAQVRTLVAWAASADLDALLSRAPKSDEGWILGAHEHLSD